jgi:cytochrome b subunit of formate dehydrogenase
LDIGVIGGADGPTCIVISSSTDWCTVAAIAIIFIAGIIIWNIGIGQSSPSRNQQAQLQAYFLPVPDLQH